MKCPMCAQPVEEGTTFVHVHVPSKVHPVAGAWHLKCDRRAMREYAASLGPAKKSRQSVQSAA